jgi:hypothetical protein
MHLVSTETLRRRMADLARSVQRSGNPVAIGTTSGRPRYVLRPATSADDAACVQLGPDEMRRNFTEIRALIRLDDISFGIRVEGQLVAVLCRHPDYRPAAAERYRELFAKLRPRDARTGELELGHRIAVLETAFTMIADRLTRLEKDGRSMTTNQIE